MLDLRYKLLLSKINYLIDKLELSLFYYEQGVALYSKDLDKIEGDIIPKQVSKIYTIEDMLKVPIDDVNIDFKNLYRKITSKTHPDKVKNNSKIEIYIEATTAVDYNNWFELIKIAAKLNLELPKPSKEQIKWLKVLIKSLAQKLFIIKTSVGWQYFIKNNKERAIYLREQTDAKYKKKVS